MNDTEFLEMAGRTLDRTEDWLEDEYDDADCSRSGNVLTVELASGEIVLNIQTPMHEIWLASRLGGFHFRPEGEAWVERRTGETLEAALRRTLARLLA